MCVCLLIRAATRFSGLVIQWTLHFFGGCRLKHTAPEALTVCHSACGKCLEQEEAHLSARISHDKSLIKSLHTTFFKSFIKQMMSYETSRFYSVAVSERGRIYVLLSHCNLFRMLHRGISSSGEFQTIQKIHKSV